MKGLLNDEDDDFNSQEVSEAEHADSFDSDFGRGDTEEETSVQDGKKRAAPQLDEDELLAKQERIERRKKAVKFAQPTLPARAVLKKRESKASAKQQTKEVRKSSRTSVIERAEIQAEER